MPNFIWPAWPPYVLNGWTMLPTFPSTWYHPVLGAQTVANATAFGQLKGAWFPTPQLADMARTQAEADLVIDNDVNAALMAIAGGSNTWPPAVPGTSGYPPVNRRSASWQEVITKGWRAATGP